MSLQPKQFRQGRLFNPVGMHRTLSAPHGPAETDLTPAWHRGDHEDYHQTRAFMPTREVIDTVHKIDSELMDRPDTTPAEQWDDVRGEKSNYQLDRAVAARAPLPPIRIQHRDDSAWGDPEPELWDGHHRLAAYEKAGHAEVPVWESFDNAESGYEVKGGMAGGGYSGNPWWSPR